MDSHTEDRHGDPKSSIKEHWASYEVQTLGPGASKGFLPAVWGGGMYMFREQLVVQDGTTR